MLAIVLMAPQALLNPFGPPRWNARRRLANRIERAALKESLNAQQGLLEYERERLKLSALSVWTDWYTSPFALSEVSRTARRPPIWPVLTHVHRAGLCVGRASARKTFRIVTTGSSCSCRT